jgi:hypothetical protein
MNDDDLLEMMKAQWRQQPVDMKQARSLIARREQQIRIWTWLSGIGVVVTIAACAWFIVSAWNGEEVLFLFGAGALLFMLIEHWWLRKHRTAGSLETPDAVVGQARRQAELMLLILKGSRLAASILITCAAAVWALHAFAAVSLGSALALSLVWAATAGLLLLWQRRRRRLTEAELAKCDRFAAELKGAE